MADDEDGKTNGPESSRGSGAHDPLIPGDPQEMSESPSSEDQKDLKSAAGNQAGPLATFLWYHPFTSYFCHLAKVHHPQDPNNRVAAFHREHRCQYGLFVFLDFLLMLVATALLVCIAIKAVWPLLPMLEPKR